MHDKVKVKVKVKSTKEKEVEIPEFFMIDDYGINDYCRVLDKEDHERKHRISFITNNSFYIFDENHLIGRIEKDKELTPITKEEYIKQLLKLQQKAEEEIQNVK